MTDENRSSSQLSASMLTLLAAIVLTQQFVLDALNAAFIPLPTVICHEQLVRSHNQKVRGTRLDDIRISSAGEEIYTNLLWNGRPVSSMDRIPKNALGLHHGMLSAAIAALAVPNRAYVSRSPNGNVVAQLDTIHEESMWSLTGAWGAYPIAHTSVVVVSPDQMQITIYNRAECPMPHVQRAEAFLQLKQTVVAGRVLLLPAKAWQVVTASDNTVSRWESTFTDYRRFEIESSLLTTDASR